MKRLTALFSFLALVAFPLSVRADSGITPPIPSSTFPASSDVTYLAMVGDNWLDCDFLIDCTDGSPAAHSTTAEQAGRIGGWGEIVEYALPTDGDAIHWTVFFNTFSTEKQSRGFLQDFTSTMPTLGVSRSSTPTLPGHSQAFHVDVSDTYHVYILVTYSGVNEIEAFTNYPTGSKKQARTALVHAVRSLATQLIPAQGQ